MTTTGYGTEVWCLDSLQTGRLVTGWMVVAQALYRRITTERGTLRGGDEEAAYGIDLAGYIGSVGTAIAVRALPAIVRAEWKKDDRVVDVDIDATIVTNSDGTVDIVLDALVTLDEEDQAFNLTIAASDSAVKVALLEAA